MAQSRKQETLDNRALASAMRAAGIKDVRTRWTEAKGLQADGCSAAEITTYFAYGPETDAPAQAPAKVATPAALVCEHCGKPASACVAERNGRGGALKVAAPVAKYVAAPAKGKAKQAKPAYVPSFTGTVPVVCEREDGQQLPGDLLVSAPHAKRNGQAGETHDIRLEVGKEHPVRTFERTKTLSPARYARLVAGGFAYLKATDGEMYRVTLDKGEE